MGKKTDETAKEKEKEVELNNTDVFAERPLESLQCDAPDTMEFAHRHLYF